MNRGPNETVVLWISFGRYTHTVIKLGRNPVYKLLNRISWEDNNLSKHCYNKSIRWLMYYNNLGHVLFFLHFKSLPCSFHAQSQVCPLSGFQWTQTFHLLVWEQCSFINRLARFSDILLIHFGCNECWLTHTHFWCLNFMLYTPALHVRR